MSTSTTDLKLIYLIISEQEFLLQHALDKLKARVSEVADIDFNYEVFEGESASADAIMAACNTLPFASERRLVVVRNVEKLSKEGIDALTKYAEDPSPTTVLALAATKLAKNTRLFKVVEKLGGVVERKISGQSRRSCRSSSRLSVRGARSPEKTSTRSPRTPRSSRCGSSLTL
jgi:DNA polymerase-3 subunit delta